MDKNTLLQTTSGLKQVSNNAAEEYAAKIDRLASIMNQRMLNRADIEELVGSKNLTMMQDNHANHARFIASVLKNLNTLELVETILWVFRAYRSRGFQTSYWAAQLNTWIDVLRTELTTASFQEVYPYYEWMQVHIPLFVNISDTNFEAPNTMH